MELDKILRKLYSERIKLNEIIAMLEQLRDAAAVAKKPRKAPSKVSRKRQKTK